MSSKSSIHLRKQPTKQKSAIPSSILKNEKEDHPKNSVTFNNQPEKTQQRQHSSTSYAQTPAAYSQYQTICLSELPSPRSWPSENTIPSQEQMDYDLLGLSYQIPSCPQYFVLASCPYHETSLSSVAEASQVGRDLTVMDRWMSEDGSESGAMFLREDTGRKSIDSGCSCALVEGSGDEMENWEES